MGAKTAAVIRQLIDDNRAMAARIERLEKVKPVAAVNGWYCKILIRGF